MSDKGDKDDDKKQSQSEIKNGVEKLIKIDKKHANFEFIDPLLNTKVKVRNINSSTSSSILGQNQPENTLRCFWRHINRYYFRRLDINELERLSYLDQLFSYKQDTTLSKQKYANHMVYTAIKESLDKERYINDNQQSPEVQKILYKIIKTSCNIHALIYECHFKDKANQKFLDQIIKEKDSIVPKKGSKKKSINELQNELQKLKAIEDKLLKKIEQNEEQIVESKPNKKKNGNLKKGNTHIEEESDDSNHQNNDDNISTASNDEVSYYAKHSTRTLEQELERLVKQLEEVNGSNKQGIKRLNQKGQIELKEGKLTFFENQNDSSTTITNGKAQPQLAQQQNKQKKKSKKNNEYSSNHVDIGTIATLPKYGGFQKELGKDPRLKMTEKELSDLHLDYLQYLIFNLEEKQVADSVSKITNCKKENKKEYHYEIQFEDALSAQPIYIDEKTLLRFNEYREHSMLKKYNLPIKTLFSSTSHNYIQLTQFVQNRNTPNPYKDQDILETMKKNAHQHHDPIHNTVLNLTRNFDICHHCRQVFELGYLIKCNYRSSVMGMPQSSQSTNEQIFISQLVEYDSNQRRPFLNRKRNNYNSYIKKSNGELVCKRKYCVHCLKQNYDFKHDHSKIDWVCPFCSNYCHCIRCLRNEMINKLKGIYLLYGGDIQYLEQESLLNKYLRPLSEDDRKRKERDDIHNRATNSSMIAFQVQKETYEKEVLQEKTLQSKLDEMTDVRLDMERVRLVISQVCRREKIKHLRFQEDYEIFKQKEQAIRRQLKRAAAKQAKQSEKESRETGKLSKKQQTPKKINEATQKLNKKKEAEAKKSNKKSKKVIEESEEEIEEEDVEESQQSVSDNSSQDEEEQIRAESESSQIEQEEENEDDEQADVEDSSEEVEEDEDGDEVSASKLAEYEEDEEEEDDNEQEEEQEVTTSEADQEIETEDSGTSDKNDESDVEEQDESEANSEVEEEEETEQEEENEENEQSEIIESDESTIEENERSKSKKKQIKSNKKKPQKVTPKNEKTRSKSKGNGNIVSSTNGKTKSNAKDGGSNKKLKDKKLSKKQKDNQINKSKFIKRTKSSLSDLLNSKIPFNKELKNLIRNQDPSILQLTSSKEKVLRSNMIPTESNHHAHKHSNIANGVGKHPQNKNNNHKKQNISKYEQAPKKKQKN